MNLTAWTPLRELDDFFSGYRNLFNRGRGLIDSPEIANADLRWRPVADISETNDEFVVKAELPEVKREDVSVSIEDGVLKIEGERKYESESKSEKQHRVESFYGSFFRAFTLPGNIDADNISANCKNGMLTIRIPKTEQDTSKAVKIPVD